MADLSAGTVSLPVKPDTRGFAAILGKEVLSAVGDVSKKAVASWTKTVGATTASSALAQRKVISAAATEVELASRKIVVSTNAELAAREKLAIATAKAAEAEKLYAADSSKVIAAQTRVAAATRAHASAAEKLAYDTTALVPLQEKHAAATEKLTGIHARGATAVGRLGDGFKSAGSAVAGMAGPLAIAGTVAVALGAESVKAAANFQTASTRLVTDAGESTKALKMVQAGILDIQAKTGTSSEDLLKGMYLIESAGYHGATGLKVLQAAAQGAKLSGADLNTVSDALTTTMKDFGKEAGPPAVAMSKLIATVSTGKTTMEALAGSLHSVLPAAQSAGLGLNEVLAAVGTMTQEGISADQATQNLNHAILALQAPSQVATKAMGGVGISALNVAQNLGKRGLAGTYDVLFKAMHDHSKAGAVVVNAFGQTAQATASLKQELKLMTPTMRAQAEAFQAGQLTSKQWAADLKQYPATVANLGRQFATTSKRASGFSDALKSGQGTTRTAAQQLLQMLGGTTGLQVALHLTGDHMKDFVANTKTISKATVDAHGNVRDWALFQKTFNQQLSQGTQAIQAAAIKVGTALMPAIQKLLPYIPKIADGIVAVIPTIKRLVDIFITVADVVGPIISEVFKFQNGLMTFQNSSNKTSTALELLHGKFGVILQVLGELGVGIGRAIKWIISLRDNVANAMLSTQNTIANTVKGWANLLPAAGRNIVDGLVNGILGAQHLITSAMNSIGSLIPNTFKKLLGINSPSKVMFKLALGVGEGVVNALLGSKAQVVSAASQIAGVVIGMFEKKRGGISKAAETSALHLITKDTAKLIKLSDQRAAVVKKIAAEQALLKAAQQTRATDATTIRDNTTGLFKVTDYTSGASMAAGLRQIIAGTKQFAGLLKRLVKAGIDPVTYRQIVDAGVGGGGITAAELLLQQPDQIKQIASLQGDLAKQATALGTTASDHLYDAGVASTQGLLKGLQSNDAALTKQMQKIADGMVSTLKSRLGVDTFYQHGLAAAKALHKGTHASTSHHVASVATAPRHRVHSAPTAAVHHVVMPDTITVKDAHGFTATMQVVAEKTYSVRSKQAQVAAMGGAR